MHNLHVLLKYFYTLTMLKFESVNTSQYFLPVEHFMSAHKQAVLYYI